MLRTSEYGTGLRFAPWRFLVGAQTARTLRVITIRDPWNRHWFDRLIDFVEPIKHIYVDKGLAFIKRREKAAGLVDIHIVKALLLGRDSVY